MKKTFLQKLGLLGIVSLLSYTAAVVFSPLAYPGYDWMAQAVSDLSAADAPSLALWNRLSAFYNVSEVVCATVVCIGIQGQKTRLLRTGVLAFLRAAMPWISLGLLVMFFCVRPNIRRHRAEEDYAAEGMCMGMCHGLAFGSLIGEGNGGLGTSLGMLIGLAAGLCLHKKEKRHEK